MRTTHGPNRLSVVTVERAVDVFRIVRSDDFEDPAFLDSLRSHYELSEEPRKVEREWTVIHMGISVYINPAQAAATAERWPRIGTYVARIELRPGHGFNIARTGFPGHLTLWGEPVKLRDATTDIESVGAAGR